MPFSERHDLQSILNLTTNNRLLGVSHPQDFEPIFLKKLAEFNDFTERYRRHPQILLVESDPVSFIATFMAGVAVNSSIFLGNPYWRELEWQQVFEQVQPDLIMGDIPLQIPKFKPNQSQDLAGLIMIPTGGSSGKIKFAVHSWKTLTASVQGFQEYFQRSQIHSYCTLPLYHVSGLMQLIRSFTTGGKIVIQSFKALQSGQIIPVNFSRFFISLVPTQLHRLLENPQTKTILSQFQTVLLGGGPAWLSLLEQARAAQIPLAPTYGMTETAAQIATLKPADFLNGTQNSGQILPHAKVKIFHPCGQELDINQIGLIQIKATSLMLGYYQPQFNLHHQISSLHSDDLGYLDAQGYLTIVGRNQDRIITGGEKVFPAEIEAMIQATGIVKDICVLGLPDQDWGEIVVAVYVPFKLEFNPDQVAQLLREKITRYKQPKLWFSVDHIPRNAQGKVNRNELKKKIIQRN